MSLVSVVVPVYNAESTIQCCVDSILSQTYRDIELLLIDDGSTDSSSLICDQISAADNRVKVFHKPNGGVSSARNLGIDYASGRYITFVDADDFAAPTLLEDLLAFSDYDVVACHFDRNGLSRKHSEVEIFTTDTYRHNVRHIIDTDLFSAPWGKLFKLEIINKFSLKFDVQMKLCEDVVFVREYLLHSSCAVIIQKYDYKYNGVWGGGTKYVLSIDEVDYALGRCVSQMKKLNDVFDCCYKLVDHCLIYIRLRDLWTRYDSEKIRSMIEQHCGNISNNELMHSKISPLVVGVNVLLSYVKRNQYVEGKKMMELIRRFVCWDFSDRGFTFKMKICSFFLRHNYWFLMWIVFRTNDTIRKLFYKY